MLPLPVARKILPAVGPAGAKVSHLDIELRLSSCEFQYRPAMLCIAFTAGKIFSQLPAIVLKYLGLFTKKSKSPN